MLACLPSGGLISTTSFLEALGSCKASVLGCCLVDCGNGYDLAAGEDMGILSESSVSCRLAAAHDPAVWSNGWDLPKVRHGQRIVCI